MDVKLGFTMNKRDKRFFQIAKVISQLSTHKKFKIGAIIVCKNKLISAGTNSDKSHPVQKRYDKERGFKTHHSCHAEVRAILNSKLSDLSNCTIFIYRETKDGSLAMARPCPACLKMIKDYKIKVINYTTVAGFCKETLM